MTTTENLDVETRAASCVTVGVDRYPYPPETKFNSHIFLFMNLINADGTDRNAVVDVDVGAEKFTGTSGVLTDVVP